MRSKRLADSGSIPCVDHKGEATQMSVIRRKTAASRLRRGLGVAALAGLAAWSPRAASLRPLRLRRLRRRRPRCPPPPGCTSLTRPAATSTSSTRRPPSSSRISRSASVRAVSGSRATGRGCSSRVGIAHRRSRRGRVEAAARRLVGRWHWRGRSATQKLLRVLPSGQIQKPSTCRSMGRRLMLN